MAAGSTDYRVYMFLGVMARDAGDRERAIDYLKKAHQLDPSAPNPALELAFTLEEKHASEAAQVYQEILARDPDNRPALLGQARVDRGQNRLDAARVIYERLLAANPKDAEALNGLAWLALAHRNRVEGRAGFEHVLTLDPNNEEAKVGLSKADSVYRYVLRRRRQLRVDRKWHFLGLRRAGPSRGHALRLAGARRGPLHQRVADAVGNRRRHVTVGRYPRRLAPAGAAKLQPLAGLRLSRPQRPADRTLDRGQHGLYLTDDLRWFGGYRQAFGAFQWDAD